MSQMAEVLFQKQKNEKVFIIKYFIRIFIRHVQKINQVNASSNFDILYLSRYEKREHNQFINTLYLFFFEFDVYSKLNIDEYTLNKNSFK